MIIKKKKEIKKENIPNLFVISGESGVGKSTLIKELCRLYNLEKVIPYTSRDKRPGEVDGLDYHFVSAEEFVSSSEIICKKKNGSNYYGLPRSLDGNVLDLDPEGIQNLKRELQTADANIVVIALEQPLLIRMWRMLKRGDKLSSIIERIRHDRMAFQSLHGLADFVCYPKCSSINETARYVWDNIISKII